MTDSDKLDAVMAFLGLRVEECTRCDGAGTIPAGGTALEPCPACDGLREVVLAPGGLVWPPVGGR